MTSILCARCGKKDEKTGHCQKYCASCQPIVKREQKTAAEQRRRAKLGKKLNEYDRKRYSESIDRKEQCKTSARKNYARIKSDPSLHADLLHRQSGWNHKTKFGDGWQAVFERDGEKCVICGSIERLGIHHKDGKGSTLPRDQRNNSLDNLVLLCQSCHMKIHAPYKERKNVKKKLQ